MNDLGRKQDSATVTPTMHEGMIRRFPKCCHTVLSSSNFLDLSFGVHTSVSRPFKYSGVGCIAACHSWWHTEGNPNTGSWREQHIERKTTHAYAIDSTEPKTAQAFALLRHSQPILMSTFGGTSSISQVPEGAAKGPFQHLPRLSPKKLPQAPNQHDTIERPALPHGGAVPFGGYSGSVGERERYNQAIRSPLEVRDVRNRLQAFPSSLTTCQESRVNLHLLQTGRYCNNT